MNTWRLSSGFTRISQAFSPSAVDVAEKNGHLKIVQWLHENWSEGCTYVAMNNTAGNGYLAMAL